jgi:hypothetical protein
MALNMSLDSFPFFPFAGRLFSSGSPFSELIAFTKKDPLLFKGGVCTLFSSRSSATKGTLLTFFLKLKA